MSINAVNTTPSTAVPLTSVTGPSSNPASSTVQPNPTTSSPSSPVSSTAPSTTVSAKSTSDSSAASSLSPTDQVTISAYGQRAAQFIQEARALPAQATAGLNADQLKQLKQQLDEGKYPPQGLTEGLLSLLGSSLIGSDGSD